tara:strand:+ start:1832 stop:2962 length:1131 start_codon:yes stop_codon:yes gene_type:complete
MDDLLKEAIADAKAVRETALENAKIALEEAFTPRLKSMLSKKIEAEMAGDEIDDEPVDDETYEVNDEEDDAPIEDEPVEDEPVADEPVADEEDADGEDEVEVDESDIIEIDGVKYAPVVSEEDHEDAEEGEVDEDSHEEEDEDGVDESDELDLEAVLSELESDLEETKDEEESKDDVEESTDKVEETKDEDDDSKVDETKEEDKESKEEVAESTDEVTEEEDKDDEEVDEDIDLEEVIKALSEEEDTEKSNEEVLTLQSELKEHREVVTYLREKLNEVNLLNAKLLFSNKLFRAFGLSNEQKLKVVETFDRTKNLREIKLVYSTLAESFKGGKIQPTKEAKGSSSKAVASTKPKNDEVLSEGTDIKNRFKKLANII